MSSLIVEVSKISKVFPHTNADRLELAMVKGWQVVIGKGSFKEGDLAVYIPVDSVLPNSLEKILFPPGSKITLNKGRVRSIRIRSMMSQGMLVPLDQVGLTGAKEGDDVAEKLGITKYEPPEPVSHMSNGKVKEQKSQENPNLPKYTNLQNINFYPEAFDEGEPVYVSEKLHGTSARYGIVPRHYKGRFAWLKRAIDSLLIFLTIRPKFQLVYGSRNVQMHSNGYGGFYKVNVYKQILRQETLDEKLRKYSQITGNSICVYGEIVGDGIQRNYTYGCGPNEWAFYAYDIRVNGEYVGYEEFVQLCVALNITPVPALYVGPYYKGVDKDFRDGDSTIGGQKIREGVVVKPQTESVGFFGRRALKSISDDYYLDESNTDFH